MKSTQTALSFESDEHIVSKSETHVKKLGILHVPFSMLTVLPDFNDREDYGTTEEMQELAESIYSTGPKVPLKGYKDGNKYVVIVGHRRHRAGEMILKKYGKNIVFPFISYSQGTREVDMLLDTLLTNSGKDLTPLEKSSTVAKLVARNAGTKEIAQALGGVSETYVKNLNKLSMIPEAAKKLIRAGVVSSTLVMGVLKNKNTNFDEWVAEIEKQANSQGTAKKKATGSKKKKASITAKNAPNAKIDGVKEFKKFTKTNKGEFKSKDRQDACEFFTQIIQNKVTLKDITEFFTGK